MGAGNDRIISYGDAGEPDPAQTEGAEGRVTPAIPPGEANDTLTGGAGNDTIGGGASEIQKNIIARRGLGLPKNF